MTWAFFTKLNGYTLVFFSVYHLNGNGHFKISDEALWHNITIHKKCIIKTLYFRKPFITLWNMICSNFLIFSFTTERKEKAVKRIKLLTPFWCRETEYFFVFFCLGQTKQTLFRKWYRCRLFQGGVNYKKKRKKLRQLYHKGLLIFLILPILELLTSRVRFVKALALSSASWNASLILSSVCVILVSFLNSMVKRTITLPFL